MFTGIIEATGQVADKRDVGGDLRLRLLTGQLSLSDVKLGDSIATNGVCLTVTGIEADGFWADVSNETLAHSTLKDLQTGDAVNLEKAMAANGRFGGHIVSGHVDGVAEIVQLNSDARSVQIEVATPEGLHRYIAHKGSITIDGVSLTVNALTARGFLLNIVPHTAQETIIAKYHPGTRVNLEVDVIARYLEQLHQHPVTEQKPALDKAFLAEHGFFGRR
ncbi:Riboflavin synthase [BD1-7 clade bacterium]|uniref:Riboflavin synthase n=1 Tax=BD1-7 clade bacterium TaxID=2029982 RepID=A0A5S9MZG7_9GAMM|nr:Riboflavin synthase [BD1-7 clade bacterium]CAA0082682.1 Riboflavin synthase [BD1-7 clade bacterium]CAA0117143.1 Riboflavin synthase [BD1-7 clade bacterium]